MIKMNMSETYLCKLEDISFSTMTKLNQGKHIFFPILDGICETLEVEYGNIIEHKKATYDNRECFKL